MLQKQHVKAIDTMQGLTLSILMWLSFGQVHLSFTCPSIKVICPEIIFFLLSYIYYYLLYLYKSHLVNLVRFFFLNQIMKTNSVIILLYVCTM